MTDIGVEKKYFDAAAAAVEFYDNKLESLLGGFDFKRMQLGDMVLRLLVKTAEFRQRAKSHRGFLVGAGANVVNYPNFGHVLGYNVKPFNSDDVNIHAEDLVSEKAARHGFEKISVLAVVGVPQPDKVTGKTALTLPPCGQRCRPRLAINPMIDRNSLIVTATPDFRTIQFTDIYGLIRSQDYDDDERVKTFTFDRTPSVFQPLPALGKHACLYNEDIETDTSDWDDAVDWWLRERWVDLYAPGTPGSEKYYELEPVLDPHLQSLINGMM